MKKEFTITVEEKVNTVVVSDELSVLLAAKAAGRAILGVYDPTNLQEAPFGVPYLIERGEEITEEFLERIVRRHQGLPWKIMETRRLMVREFITEDWEILRKNGFPAFSEYQEFLSYRDCQYPFYEYGIWAVLEKGQGILVGAAGIWDWQEAGDTLRESAGVELGYWICPSERRQGYGREAVEGVLHYVREHLNCPVYMRIRKGNFPSQKVAENCGFTVAAGQNEARTIWYQCGRCQPSR